ncbi:MAG: FliI/YscN family ATPase [Alicyclobacillaceae bacterium]|uniref:FliI/YscN family ATPase n=1 Tax=Alicyclobacillus sp. SP_1 TaxID=2942475 RepID=UPI0021571FC0|nr:FliI/YscN family ATPase [Alicyclobacillus sp. SP_1]MCY0887207.1 FliI/YscN family ATPase [Alicyclobacillaceae bacterium]
MTNTLWFDEKLQQMRLFRLYGRVVKVVGMTIESMGPKATIGDICSIQSDGGAECTAEVVGFREDRLILMPLGEIKSVSPGADVTALGSSLAVPCGPNLRGRILDGLGQPMDGLGPVQGAELRLMDGASPHPLERQRIAQPMPTGVRVIDSLLTVGRGQRMGIFAGSGVGKSTLLSMIARHSQADVNVIGLIGERGREVREFLENDLGTEGLGQSVVIVATSDQPALIRIKAAMVATTVAEYFRDEGYHVNFMLDSITRFAMAQREIGLAVGEPPTSRGYTPSVFAMLPRLLERSGAGKNGTITAFYTVLVDGDDMNDPIADAVRGILDGHMVLSRTIANAGHFPAVDVLASLSRLFPSLATPVQATAARQVRSWMQRYREVEDLVRIGAYQPGADPDADMAIRKLPEIHALVRQHRDEAATWEDTLRQLECVSGVVV